MAVSPAVQSSGVNTMNPVFLTAPTAALVFEHCESPAGKFTYHWFDVHLDQKGKRVRIGTLMPRHLNNQLLEWLRRPLEVQPDMTTEWQWVMNFGSPHGSAWARPAGDGVVFGINDAKGKFYAEFELDRTTLATWRRQVEDAVRQLTPVLRG